MQKDYQKAESSCGCDCCSPAELLQVREFAGLRLAEADYSPCVELPQHSHPNAHFCLLLQGRYEENWNSNILVRKPGSLMFVASGESHSGRIYKSGIRCLTVEMSPHWLQRVNGHSKSLQGLSQFDAGSLPWLAMRLYREFRAVDEVASLAIEGLVLQLLAGVARQNSHPENGGKWLKKAEDLIRDRFQESITLTDVAEFAGVHPVSLARAFRQKYGCTVGEHVRQLRIEFACKKLASSDASLAEIALGAGFSEQSHFSRTFKRLIGQTPSEYRLSHQG